jgi:hypothetical protein
MKDTKLRTVSGNPIHKEENFDFRLSNIEVNLPLFDDSKDANPMFHLKQLEQYFDLKGIPVTQTCDSM